MGILPDQPGGTSLDFDLLADLFGVSADGSIPGLALLTQPNVEATLKQREISESPGWLGANDAAYGGLLPGVALVPNILMNVAVSIIGLPFSMWPGEGPLGFIGEIPNILSDIGNFFFNLTGIFGGGVDFNDLAFNPIEAVFNFVETMIVPTDLLASLIGGFIPGLQIPGLDASKIISGTFPMEMILGLPEALAELVVGGAQSIIDIFVNTFLGLGGEGHSENDLITAITSIPSMFLAGPLAPGLASNLGAGILSSDTPEFVTNGGFDAPSSVQGQGLWTWDGTTGPAGLSTSVFADANGILKELFSNAIPVSAGQELTITGFSKWSTFTGAANSIALTVRKFNASGTYIGDDTIASIAAPSGTSAWPGSPNLSATYTVPSGVVSIFVRPAVLSTATAGRVWFGKLSAKPVATNILAQLIPGLDASKIITGQFGMDMVSNLTDMLFGFATGESILDQIIGAIPGAGGGATGLTGLASIFTDLFGLLGDPEDVGTGSPSVSPLARLPIIGGLLDGLFGGFTGILDQPADQALVADAASGVSASLTGQAAALAQLEAALSPGNPDADDFERSNSGNWGPDWLVMEDGGGGDASVDGHNAVWSGDYGVDTEMVARRLAKQAAGQNQSVSVVLASSFTAVTDGNPAVDLWLRCTAFTTWATRTGLRCRFSGNRDIEVAWFNNGTKVWALNGTSPLSFASSTTLVFQAGEGLLPRRFIAKVNGQPIVFDEVGTASSLTGTWRGAGGRAEFSLIFFPPLEMQPGKFKQWTATG